MYTIAEWKDKIIDLLGTDNEGRIIEVWNECVERYSTNTEICKIYNASRKEIYDIINKYYNLDDIVDILFNISISQCSEFDDYFFITNDNVFHTTDDIWGCMDLQLLHDYIEDYYPIIAYGRKWKANKYTDLVYKKNEVFMLEMENGDTIYCNDIDKYLALYNPNSKNVYYSRL